MVARRVQHLSKVSTTSHVKLLAAITKLCSIFESRLQTIYVPKPNETTMSCNPEVRDSLSQLLEPLSEVRDADAAVALLLRPANQDFIVLLVKRVESPLDPWSGQMALPGGKRDSKDRDIQQTAIRETMEETNINLAHNSCFLGALETVRSIVRPRIQVAAFVFLLEHEPKIRLNEELAGHLWVPMRQLQKCRGTAKLSFGDVPAFLVDGHVVWGLTYRILEVFFHVLEKTRI